MNSASPLLLANSRTGESRRSASTCEAISAATSAAEPSTYLISTSYRRTDRSRTMRHLRRVPATNFAAAATLPTVADSPTRATSRREASERRSRLTDSCAPRSLASSSWTSSITAHSRSEKAASMRSWESMTTSDSGVVISTSGGCSAMRLRRRCGVSPWRISTDRPAARAYSVMRRNTSLFRARRGVTYRAPIRPRRPWPPPCRRALPRRSKIGTTAHSVLPEPVGATTSASLFWCITGEARRCMPVSSAKPSDAKALDSLPSGRGLFAAAPAPALACAATVSAAPAPACAPASPALAAAAVRPRVGIGGGGGGRRCRGRRGRIAGIALAAGARIGALCLRQPGPRPLIDHDAYQPRREEGHHQGRNCLEYVRHAVRHAAAVK